MDPHTPGIFDGEEFNRAARFWTYGYDIYTPNRGTIFCDIVCIVFSLVCITHY